ncbi:MAG: hypothetical protein ABI621_00425 [Chloroflexota bacterium]
MSQKPSPRSQQFFPNVNAILVIILFVSALTVGPRMLNLDGDLPRHLLMGKVVLGTGVAPTQEIFSYPYENKSYVPHEWLAGVIYYSLFYLLGLNGVVLLASILIAGSFGMIYSEVRQEKNRIVLPFLLIMLGASVTSIHWVARPHLFTMLFLATWLVLIDRLSRGVSVKLWVFPALMLLWANIHAEFISGFLVLVAYLGGWVWQYIFTRANVSFERLKKFMIVTILSFTVSLLNPTGFRIWDTVVGYINNRYLMARIVETRPPDFARAEYWPLLILLGIAALFPFIKRGEFTPAHFFLMTGFGIMSLISARNSHLFGVVAPFVLCMAIQKTGSPGPIKKIEEMVSKMEGQITGYILPIIVTILVSALLIAYPLKELNRFEPTVFPVDAVQWLENHPQSGRMFNAFDWGGYILLRLWPNQRVFIESQTDLSGELTQKYETVITLNDGWQEIFRKYNITWAIIPPTWDLARELTGQGWETAYQDQTAIILVKR